MNDVNEGLLRVSLSLVAGTRFGMHLNDFNTVVRLDAGGLAATEGTLRTGDQIVSVNGASTTGGLLVRDLLKRDGTIRQDGTLRQDGRDVILLARRAPAADSPPPPARGADLQRQVQQDLQRQLAQRAAAGSTTAPRSGSTTAPRSTGAPPHAMAAASDWLRSRLGGVGAAAAGPGAAARTGASAAARAASALPAGVGPGTATCAGPYVGVGAGDCTSGSDRSERPSREPRESGESAGYELVEGWEGDEAAAADAVAGAALEARITEVGEEAEDSAGGEEEDTVGEEAEESTAGEGSPFKAQGDPAGEGRRSDPPPPPPWPPRDCASHSYPSGVTIAAKTRGGDGGSSISGSAEAATIFGANTDRSTVAAIRTTDAQTHRYQ